MSCTIVTAYYCIKSKFNKSKYLEWGKTFMKLESPIVIFTEEYLIPELKKLREDRPIKFVSIPFDELDTWKLYKDKWIQNHTIDPEKAYHTPELYAVWAQKPFFVEKAIHSNYFNTNYYFWCDFGAFRDPNINNNVLQKFPLTLHFDDKLLMQSVGDLSESEKVIREDGIYGEKISECWNKIRLVGGLWGGNSNACLKWKTEYQKMLETYFLKNRFAGKDQVVMLSTYINNPTLAKIVTYTLYGIDEWFFLEHLLSDTNVEYRLNNTYKIEDKRPVVSVNIMGGLGNQLFQIATAYAYAKKENGTLKIVKKRDNGNRPVYWDVFKNLSPYLVENSSDLPQLKQWHERGPTEYTDIEPLSYPGIFLNGYLQSSKYFKDDIKELFKIDNLEINTKEIDKYQYLLDNSKRVIVIHARRTDYITYKEVHGPLDVDYYKKAIDMMLTKVENSLFVLTSDDNSFWDQIKLNHEHVIVNDTDINTFILLQKFNNFIMANSTFIWWVVWLSNSKNVIAPSKWFGPKGPQKYEDIYEDSWIRI